MEVEVWKFSRCLLAIPLVLLSVTGCTPGDDQAQIDSFNEMARNPDQALDMLYPDGVVEPGTSTEAIRLIRDSEWTDNEFDALAKMLDAAATAHRTKDDPRAELSALAATDTINLLGQRDNLPNTGNDSLGHLLANYIIDIDSNVNDITEITLSHLGTTFDGLPPSADFDLVALATVVTKAMKSPDAISQITNAALQLNANRTAGAIQSGAEYSLVYSGVQQNLALLDYLFKRAGFPLGRTIGEQRQLDDRSSAMVKEFERSLSLLPEPNARFADFLNGEDITAHRDPPLTNRYVHIAYKNASLLYRTAKTSVSFMAAVQLGEAGLLDQIDGKGDTRPWFIDGRFDATVATDEDHYSNFYDSLGFDDVWHRMFVRLE